jgi:hypothetical protein
MTKYDFSIILAGPFESPEDLADRLFAAGCDDATPGACAGVVSVDFAREAESLESAIRSAIADIQKAGYRTASVSIDTESLTGA